MPLIQHVECIDHHPLILGEMYRLMRPNHDDHVVSTRGLMLSRTKRFAEKPLDSAALDRITHAT